MGKVLLLSLLLVILMVIPDGAFGAISEESMCFEPDVVSEGGDMQLITSKTFEKFSSELDLYFLKNEVNLMDVRINVLGGNESQQGVSFPLDECFQHEVQPVWQLLQIWSTKIDDRISVGISFENYVCQKSCLINGHWQIPLHICVFTSVFSKWKLQWPLHCPSNFTRIDRNSKESTRFTCKNDGSNLWIIVVLAILLAMMLVGLVFVVMYCKKRQQQQQPGKSREQLYDTCTFQSTGGQSGKNRGPAPLRSKNAAASDTYDEVIVYDDVAPERPKSNVYANYPLYDEVVPNPVNDEVASGPVYEEVDSHPVYDEMVSGPIYEEMTPAKLPQ
ncbi:uncharacterized protein LOC123508270 [Portunus trituberculatus]|uniref:uncharacterized protein LOC123508270 n=1 Tax=Portunus trituberculatus TaxID=210409 RepID=UPI001E1D1AA1|nr:uncharacterized protein LOC123508270 [Portunus trituberculatus]